MPTSGLSSSAAPPSPLPPSSSSSSYSTAAATATATRLTSAGAVVAAAAADSVISTNGGGTSRIMTVSLNSVDQQTASASPPGTVFARMASGPANAIRPGPLPSTSSASFSTPSSIRSSPRISPMLAPSPMNATSAAASILHSSLNISTPPSPNLRPNPAHQRSASSLSHRSSSRDSFQSSGLAPSNHSPKQSPARTAILPVAVAARSPSTSPSRSPALYTSANSSGAPPFSSLALPNPYAVQMFVGSSAAVDTEEYHSPSSMGGQPYSVYRLRRGSVGHHFASQSAPSSPDHAGFPSLSHNLPFPQPPQGVATPYSGQPPLLAHTASLPRPRHRSAGSVGSTAAYHSAGLAGVSSASTTVFIPAIAPPLPRSRSQSRSRSISSLTPQPNQARPVSAMRTPSLASSISSNNSTGPASNSTQAPSPMPTLLPNPSQGSLSLPAAFGKSTGHQPQSPGPPSFLGLQPTAAPVPRVYPSEVVPPVPRIPDHVLLKMGKQQLSGLHAPSTPSSAPASASTPSASASASASGSASPPTLPLDAGTPISTAARGRSPLPFRTTTAAAFADDADDSDVEVDKEHLAAPLSSRHFLFRQHQPQQQQQQQQQQQPQGGKGVVKFLAAVVGGKRRKNAAAAAAAAIAVD
ncbi:hypothetical protein DFJ73DRAFT_965344 [Zopfochytrium polystomum]|nr:hypothetical protein DFJ73DRAFT_965344 [Zopfochytrium polystomum]